MVTMQEARCECGGVIRKPNTMSDPCCGICGKRGSLSIAMATIPPQAEIIRVAPEQQVLPKTAEFPCADCGAMVMRYRSQVPEGHKVYCPTCWATRNHRTSTTIRQVEHTVRETVTQTMTEEASPPHTVKAAVAIEQPPVVSKDWRCIHCNASLDEEPEMSDNICEHCWMDFPNVMIALMQYCKSLADVQHIWLIWRIGKGKPCDEFSPHLENCERCSRLMWLPHNSGNWPDRPSTKYCSRECWKAAQ